MATVKTNLILRITGYALILSAFLLTAACGPSKSTLVEPPENVGAEEAAVIDDFDGDGMELPMDGTSLAAFEASMARVKRHTDESSYKTLENAIEYLLVYDLSARRDKTRLAANLNGLNGYEIIDKVGWRKPAPGKGQAEKGAADAKIIDS
ncbi:MAG: hypothetical protein KJN69_00780 [Gammaproteobacteria bacterium]|nr:hypothetical protein [Gammaproteobacteria bacterium]